MKILIGVLFIISVVVVAAIILIPCNEKVDICEIAEEIWGTFDK